MATDLLVEDDPKDPSFGLLIAHYEFKEEVGRFVIKLSSKLLMIKEVPGEWYTRHLAIVIVLM